MGKCEIASARGPGKPVPVLWHPYPGMNGDERDDHSPAALRNQKPIGNVSKRLVLTVGIAHMAEQGSVDDIPTFRLNA